MDITYYLKGLKEIANDVWTDNTVRKMFYVSLGVEAFMLSMLLLSAGAARYEKIETGFANPRKIEIRQEDSNGNGSLETMVVYEGKEYGFKMDNNNELYIEKAVSRGE
jgi:hypothetical protein